MRAKYKTLSEHEIRQEVAKEFDRQVTSVQRDTAIQLTAVSAVFLCTMEVLCGWKKRRLNWLLRAILSMFKLMSKKCMMQGELKTTDCVLHLKEKYGIDLEKEISVESKIYWVHF